MYHHVLQLITHRNLPREIRNIIYHKVLTSPDGKFFIGTEYSTKLCRSKAIQGGDQSNMRSLSPCPSTDPDQHVASTRNLALLRTSKTIYAEAGAILYGQELVFANLIALQSFLVDLRPSQISLLRHVVLRTGHWARIDGRRDVIHHFMPTVFTLLGGANSLETLDPGIRRLGPMRLGLYKAVLLDETLSVAGWDAVVARIMATAVYYHLFTYLRPAAAVRGIEKVLGVLDVFGDDFQNGPCPTAYIGKLYQPRHVMDAEWTEERGAAMKQAMGEEIERLLKQDKI